MGSTGLTKELKSQQTTAIILAVVPLNVCTTKKIKRKGREKKCKCETQPPNPNHTIIKTNVPTIYPSENLQKLLM